MPMLVLSFTNLSEYFEYYCITYSSW